jgi:DNA-binding Xre family transcriptional regulator
MILRMSISMHEAIANNLSKLKDHYALSQDDIAKKTGLSQRTVSNALKPGSINSITTETIECLARYFQVQPYHLLIPDLPLEELLSQRIEKLVECYSQTDMDGRNNISRIAENEARYSVNLKFTNSK